MSHADREVVTSGPVLTLARFREGDVEAVHVFASDRVVCRFTGWSPNTLGDTRAFIADAVQCRSDRFDLAVVRGVEFLASASVWTMSPEHRVGGLGYTIRRDRWSRGYTTEVPRLLPALGSDQSGLERLAATLDPPTRPLCGCWRRRVSDARGCYVGCCSSAVEGETASCSAV